MKRPFEVITNEGPFNVLESSLYAAAYKANSANPDKEIILIRDIAATEDLTVDVWLKEPIDFAFELYGQQEVLGPGANPEIIKLFKDVGFDHIKDDAVAWCAALVNACNFRAGHETTGSLLARRFLKIGKPVKLEDLKFGDMVIFARPPKDWQGHSGYFINFIDPNIYVLGGNQANAVNIIGKHKDLFLGGRRTEAIEEPETEASVCDTCANYLVSPSGVEERCIRVQDRAIPEAYFDARRKGQEPNCSLHAPII